MPSNWFFIEAPLIKDERVVLAGEEFHHAKGVMRVRETETVFLMNGKGREAKATVESIGKKELCLRIYSVADRTPKKYHFTLALSLLRPGHLDFVVEKGTELGVNSFVFFAADLSERKEVSESLHRRLKALAIAALKQSGGGFLPELIFCKSLEEALSCARLPIVWADMSSDAVTLSEAFPQGKSQSLTLFIGPESGWSERERKVFHKYGPPIRLHDTILRSETAGIIGAYAGLCAFKEV